MPDRVTPFALAPLLLIARGMRALCLTLVACLSVACGKTEASGPPTTDAGGRDSDVARDAGHDAPDGEVCVDIELTAADRACTYDSDCTLVGATGTVCITDCCGGGAPANTTAAGRVAMQEAVITNGLCPGGCPEGPHARCVDGSCVACPPGFQAGPPACVDASAPDGATCIKIDETFPGTCEKATDCTAVLMGTVCSNTCACEANTAIPTMWLETYKTDLGGIIPLTDCHCPAVQVTCAGGQCLLCPSPGTPNPPDGCD